MVTKTGVNLVCSCCGRVGWQGLVWLARVLLDHTKIESTVRYLGVDIEDALALAESTEV
jgi:hypothetical protein